MNFVNDPSRVFILADEEVLSSPILPQSKLLPQITSRLLILSTGGSPYSQTSDGSRCQQRMSCIFGLCWT
jgi:hypothetical protein